MAPHLNGVYLGDANLAIARMFDLERIEVLKGPQGTLYGRNSTGGSMNFITRAPVDSTDAQLELSYGSFETARAQGHVNLPMGKAASRIAFIASDGDGYIRNTVDDRRFAEDDYWGLRGAMRVTPRDDLRIDFTAQSIRDDGGARRALAAKPEFPPVRNDIRLTTVTLENPYLIRTSITSTSTSSTSSGSLPCGPSPATRAARCETSTTAARISPWLRAASAPRYRMKPSNGARSCSWSSRIARHFRNRGRVLRRSDGELEFMFTRLLETPPLREDSHSTFSDPAAALFGQATVRLADRWSATAGVRLSREEHRMSSIGTGVDDVPLVVGEIDSDDLSWRLDVSTRSPTTPWPMSAYRPDTRAAGSISA